MALKTVHFLVLFPLLVGLVSPLAASGQGALKDPQAYPAIQNFLAGGLGELHVDAPPETQQFSRLVGIWNTKQEMLARDGTWRSGAPGIWVWKHTLGGFAVQDLWFQSKDQLPSYMGDFGRDYLLSGLRIFDARAGQWKVAWIANGAGKTPGSDSGTFSAEFSKGSLVMTSPPEEGFGQQRVVFSDFTEDSFRWRSEHSRDDGETWVTVMRVSASRLVP